MHQEPHVLSRILLDSLIILKKKEPSWYHPRGAGLTTLEAMKEDSP